MMSQCDVQCSGTWRKKWGPTFLLALAVPLVSADPLRHVLQGAHLICSNRRVDALILPFV